jgi:hypothetical protein
LILFLVILKCWEFFLVRLGFELRATLAKKAVYHLSHTSIPFCSGYFEDGISRTIFPGWPQTSILPISALQVARITGTSHQGWLNWIS